MEENKQRILNVNIGGFICQLSINDERYFNILKNYFITLDNRQKIRDSILIEIQVDEKEERCGFFYSKKKDSTVARYIVPSDAEFSIFKFSLSKFIQSMVIDKDIVFLHGSSFFKKNKAYVFCGPSGIGKSTLIRQTKKNDILSDDIAVLKKINKKFYLYTSPFDKATNGFTDIKKVALESVYFLDRGDKVKIKKLSFEESFESLIFNTNFFYSKLHNKKLNTSTVQKRSSGIRNIKKKSMKIYSLLINLTTNYPCLKLELPKKNSFIDSL